VCRLSHHTSASLTQIQVSGLRVNKRMGALLLCPCLFHPSDNVWRSRCAEAPLYAHPSTVISPSWITEQISVGKCAHRGASAHWERQTSFKIVTWTKQTWTTHHNTKEGLSCTVKNFIFGKKISFFQKHQFRQNLCCMKHTGKRQPICY